jgi:flagellar hook assembly protein FlgD
VELDVYNILGQKVKTLVNQYQNAGYKMVHWNSRDDEGNEIASCVTSTKSKALNIPRPKRWSCSGRCFFTAKNTLRLKHVVLRILYGLLPKIKSPF